VALIVDFYLKLDLTLREFFCGYLHCFLTFLPVREGLQGGLHANKPLSESIPSVNSREESAG
jgi:hypothetical protein